MKGSYRRHVARDGAVSWYAVVDLPADPVTGARRQKRITTGTKKEAEAAVARVIHEVETGTYLEATTATTGEYLLHWLEAASATLRSSTYRRYRGALSKQIIPAIGSVPLAKLSGAHLQRFYADRLAAGLSPTTVSLYAGSILHKAFHQAVRWRLIGRNPCDDATPPRPARVEMQVWTADQVRTFLTATADHELHALFRLALTLGIRQGELLGLAWDDVDLERATLAIRRSLSRDLDGAPTYNEPKSQAGRRAIALPASCVAALKRHRVRQTERRLQAGALWCDEGLVFDRGDGRPFHHNTARQTFRRLAIRCGLPAIRFHDARHTAATIALADGQHPKIVQERLGHSDIAMTLNRYSHVSMTMQHEAADRLERLLGS